VRNYSRSCTVVENIFREEIEAAMIAKITELEKELQKY